MEGGTEQGGELEKSVDGRVVLASAHCHVSCGLPGIFMMDLLARRRPEAPTMAAWPRSKPCLGLLRTSWSGGAFPPSHRRSGSAATLQGERAPRDAHVPGSEHHGSRRPDERAVGYHCSIYCAPSQATPLCLRAASQELHGRFCCLRPCAHRLGWALGVSVTRERGCGWISIPAQIPPALPRALPSPWGWLLPGRG